ncbi:MAG: DUF2058 domain-containing protein [Rhodanobacter sp.]
MRNPLQEQLLKAGLIKKDKAAQIVRQQANQRRAKAPAAPDHVDALKLQAERAEHDRALSAERNAQLRANEQRAQVRQIIASHQVKREGDLAYRFTDGDKIKDIFVSEPQRAQLAAGALVIVRDEQSYALLQRPAAAMIYARDATQIVLDHGDPEASVSTDPDDAQYSEFKVPDDLIW